MSSSNTAKNRFIVGFLVSMIIILGGVLLWSIGTGQFEYKADEVNLPANHTTTPMPTSY